MNTVESGTRTNDLDSLLDAIILNRSSYHAAKEQQKPPRDATIGPLI